MPLYFFLYHGAKKSKMTKNSNQGGGGGGGGGPAPLSARAACGEPDVSGLEE